VGERHKTELPKGTITERGGQARQALFPPEVYESPSAAGFRGKGGRSIDRYLISGEVPALGAKLPN